MRLSAAAAPRAQVKEARRTASWGTRRVWSRRRDVRAPRASVVERNGALHEPVERFDAICVLQRRRVEVPDAAGRAPLLDGRAVRFAPWRHQVLLVANDHDGHLGEIASAVLRTRVPRVHVRKSCVFVNRRVVAQAYAVREPHVVRAEAVVLLRPRRVPQFYKAVLFVRDGQIDAHGGAVRPDFASHLVRVPLEERRLAGARLTDGGYLDGRSRSWTLRVHVCHHSTK